MASLETLDAQGRVTVSAETLQSLVVRLFEAGGVPGHEAAVVAESLVDSNLCGHESHGVMRAAEYLSALRRGELRTDAPLEVQSGTGAAIVCDGHYGFGQVQMRRLIDLVRPLAESQGVACGTIRRCGHIGRLGEWVERLATAGMASLVSVNDNGVFTCVAPPGGVEPRISTNPIAIGVPTDGDPLVLDISTSVVANGKIRLAQLAGQSVPPGWLLDPDGNPTTDSAVRKLDPPGTVLPMGGYKGFGLGLMLDILVGGLSGGYCPPAPQTEIECNNVLMIVLNPDRFHGRTHFLTQCQALISFVRNTKCIAGVDEIRLPNDHSHRLHKERLVHGVPLDPGTREALTKWAGRLNVPLPPEFGG